MSTCIIELHVLNDDVLWHTKHPRLRVVMPCHVAVAIVARVIHVGGGALAAFVHLLACKQMSYEHLIRNMVHRKTLKTINFDSMRSRSNMDNNETKW